MFLLFAYINETIETHDIWMWKNTIFFFVSVEIILNVFQYFEHYNANNLSVDVQTTENSIKKFEKKY